MLSPITSSRSKRKLVPVINQSTSAYIEYTGSASGAWDRDDATGGGTIDTTPELSTPSLIMASGSFTLRSKYLFFDDPINISGGGNVAFWAGLNYDLNGSFQIADYFNLYVYLTDEAYDAGFAWNNNPGRIAGEKTLIWNLLGSTSHRGTARVLHMNPLVLVKVAVPDGVDVHGVEIAIEPYTTGSGTFSMLVDATHNDTPYPFCDLGTLQSAIYRFNGYAGELDGTTGRFIGQSWNCNTLAP